MLGFIQAMQFSGCTCFLYLPAVLPWENVRGLHVERC